MSRSRGYCFVCNNYTDVTIAQLMELAETGFVTYIVVGFEKAPKTGTPHIQGYMHFSFGRTMKTVCERVDIISLQEAKAAGENYDRRYTYCMKDNEYWEYGDRPMDGVNTSTKKVIDAIKEGKKVDQLYRLFPSYMIHHAPKVKNYIAAIKPKLETKFYVMQEQDSMQEAIQMAYENLPGIKLACVTELSELKGYDEYDTVLYFCDTFDKKQTLWAYGAPILYKYGYEQVIVNCINFIIVTSTVKFYNNYKKII